MERWRRGDGQNNRGKMEERALFFSLHRALLLLEGLVSLYLSFFCTEARLVDVWCLPDTDKADKRSGDAPKTPPLLEAQQPRSIDSRHRPLLQTQPLPPNKIKKTPKTSNPQPT